MHCHCCLQGGGCRRICRHLQRKPKQILSRRKAAVLGVWSTGTWLQMVRSMSRQKGCLTELGAARRVSTACPAARKDVLPGLELEARGSQEELSERRRLQLQRDSCWQEGGPGDA